MLKALDRSVATATERLVLLAPPAKLTSFSGNVTIDSSYRNELLAQTQRLRGAIYFADHAIQPHQLTADGRHETPEDDASWHFLLVDKNDRVLACALYLEHEGRVRFEDTRAAVCPLLLEPEWRQPLWRAMEAELKTARRHSMKYVELGGWAIDQTARGSSGTLAMALAVWAFGRRDSGALGMTTATHRHCSATILKRLGGAKFEIDGQALPPYFDSRYGCMMELLRFDSRRPTPQYLPLIDQMAGSLNHIKVVKPSALPMAMRSVRSTDLAMAVAS